MAVATTTNEFYGGVDFTPDLTPLITANPANYETTAGNIAPFSVTVQSVSTLSYQWLQNGTNLDGSINPTATNANLSLPSVSTSYDGNTYQCVITNNYGAVTSSVATLNVTITPKLAQFTATNNLLGFVGSTKIFPVVPAVGTQPFYTYQWFNSSLQPLVDDGVKYSGSQTASLIISNLTLADSGSYYLSISNAAGNSATNPIVVLTVSYQLPYVPAPAPATTLVGTPVSLTADESGGTPPLTYQWYNGNTPLSPSSEFSNPSGSYAGAGSATLGIRCNHHGRFRQLQDCLHEPRRRCHQSGCCGFLSWPSRRTPLCLTPIKPRFIARVSKSCLIPVHWVPKQSRSGQRRFG